MSQNDNTPSTKQPSQQSAQPADQQSDYYFGGLKEFNLEQIESEVLNESIYLDVFAGSDMRLKTEVRDLGSTLDSISKLDTILYKWNPEVPSPLAIGEGDQVGLVAQQVAEVFPELVKKEETTGHLMINYPKLTTHLVSAVKELNQRIQELEKKLANSTH